MIGLSNKKLYVVAVILTVLFLTGRYLDQKKFEIKKYMKSSIDVEQQAVTKESSAQQKHSSEIEERLAGRRQSMLDSCAKQHSEETVPTDVAYVKNRFLKTSLFFSDKYKIAFCQIPKCATRSQAKFLAAMDELIPESDLDKISEPRATSLIEKHRSARNAKSLVDITKKLDTYTKVVIVREPFSRLLSAYRNKLENNKRKDGYAKTASRLHVKYGNGTGEEKDGAPVINLDDFISHLTDKTANAQIDQHWNFFHRLCSPCELKYDYIIQMSEIEEDMQFLIEKFKISNLTFPPSFDSFTDNAIVNKYFSQASPNLVNALYHTYKLDYDLFGYPPPPQF